MDFAFFLIQLLNGLQYGLLLFLVASGLTLVFGIMGHINLRHGKFYMVGAYLAWSLTSITGSLAATKRLAIPLTFMPKRARRSAAGRKRAAMCPTTPIPRRRQGARRPSLASPRRRVARGTTDRAARRCRSRSSPGARRHS